MQRKLHSINKTDDQYTKVNGRIISIIFTAGILEYFKMFCLITCPKIYGHKKRDIRKTCKGKKEEIIFLQNTQKDKSTQGMDVRNIQFYRHRVMENYKQTKI